MEDGGIHHMVVVVRGAAVFLKGRPTVLGVEEKVGPQEKEKVFPKVVIGEEMAEVGLEKERGQAKKIAGLGGVVQAQIVCSDTPKVEPNPPKGRGERVLHTRGVRVGVDLRATTRVHKSPHRHHNRGKPFQFLPRKSCQALWKLPHGHIPDRGGKFWLKGTILVGNGCGIPLLLPKNL